MNKKQLKYLINGSYVVLVFLIIFLFVFPLSPSTSSRVNTSIEYDILPIKSGEKISQFFVGNVEDMNNITLSFELKDLDLSDYSEEQLKQLKKGSFTAQLYDNNTLIVESSIEASKIFDDSNWNIAFQPYNGTYKKEMKLNLTYHNEDSNLAFPMNISKSAADDRYIISGDTKIKENLTINTFGKREDYFFAWYPALLLVVIFTLSSFANRGDKK